MRFDKPEMSGNTPGGPDEGRRLQANRATATLLFLNVATFAALWGVRAMSPRAGQAVHHVLWNSPPLVTDRLWLWQIITANFVHSGIIHLSVNMFFVLCLGPRLERSLGTFRFAAFYLGAGMFAYAVYDGYACIFTAWGATGGASGCVLAVAVLYTLSFPARVVHLYGWIRVPFRWIVLLFIFSDVSSFFWPGGIEWINNVVHLAGAGFGAAFWYLSGRKVNLDEPS